MKDLINRINNTDYTEANSIIRLACGIVDYFSSEKEKNEFVSIHEIDTGSVCEDRVSYGDWQTPMSLAERICDIHLSKYGSPDVVVEPTCGLGAFVLSALDKFQDIKELYAIEINGRYTSELKLKILQKALDSPLRSHPDIYICNTDFFAFDFTYIIEKIKRMGWNMAVIGNPPWVTNSTQGKNDSNNIPFKNNSYGLKGIDAITGKSNFDISESITLKLLQLSHINNGGISFLLKNSVIRNILTKQYTERLHIGNIEQRLIDASAEFNVSVDASCFFARFDCSPSFLCDVWDFYSNTFVHEYGWVNGSFVSDTQSYGAVSKYDHKSSYVWRSGIKHDCASVLELTLSDGIYTNGFGEAVQIEEDLIYPLLKSSDINNYQGNQSRKFIIIPQRKVGADTFGLQFSHPLAFSYLTKYESVFTNRKSSIYKGKGKFSIFGIGDYSFKPYKIAVSSLYKNLKFILVPQLYGKPVMVDDTCYQLDFDNLEEAKCILEALNSNEIQTLMQSLVFKDAKRVITKSLLMRIDLVQICLDKGFKIKSQRFSNGLHNQPSLFD